MSKLGNEHSDCLKAKTTWLDAFGMQVQSLKRADIELREGDVAFLTLSLGGLKRSVIKFKEPFYV
jgi:hypothetical protein